MLLMYIPPLINPPPKKQKKGLYYPIYQGYRVYDDPPALLAMWLRAGQDLPSRDAHMQLPRPPRMTRRSLF